MGCRSLTEAVGVSKDDVNGGFGFITEETERGDEIVPFCRLARGAGPAVRWCAESAVTK